MRHARSESEDESRNESGDQDMCICIRTINEKARFYFAMLMPCISMYRLIYTEYVGLNRILIEMNHIRMFSTLN